MGDTLSTVTRQISGKLLTYAVRTVSVQQFGAVVGTSEFSLTVGRFSLSLFIPEAALAGKPLGVLVTIRASLSIIFGQLRRVFCICGESARLWVAK